MKWKETIFQFKICLRLATATRLEMMSRGLWMSSITFYERQTTWCAAVRSSYDCIFSPIFHLVRIWPFFFFLSLFSVCCSPQWCSLQAFHSIFYVLHANVAICISHFALWYTFLRFRLTKKVQRRLPNVFHWSWEDKKKSRYIYPSVNKHHIIYK